MAFTLALAALTASLTLMGARCPSGLAVRGPSIPAARGFLPNAITYLLLLP
jgi:hypothetical protein